MRHVYDGCMQGAIWLSWPGDLQEGVIAFGVVSKLFDQSCFGAWTGILDAFCFGLLYGGSGVQFLKGRGDF